MMTNILAVNFGQGIITFVFTVVCCFLILVILLQKGRGGGLSGAFGGGGGHSAFGAKTGDVFTWVTVGLTGLFILMAVLGNYVFVPPDLKSTAAISQTTTQPAGTTGQPGRAPASQPH